MVLAVALIEQREGAHRAEREVEAVVVLASTEHDEEGGVGVRAGHVTSQLEAEAELVPTVGGEEWRAEDGRGEVPRGDLDLPEQLPVGADGACRSQLIPQIINLLSHFSDHARNIYQR